MNPRTSWASAWIAETSASHAVRSAPSSASSDRQGVNFQLPTANLQLPTSNYQPPTSNRSIGSWELELGVEMFPWALAAWELPSWELAVSGVTIPPRHVPKRSLFMPTSRL